MFWSNTNKLHLVVYSGNTDSPPSWNSFVCFWVTQTRLFMKAAAVEDTQNKLIAVREIQLCTALRWTRYFILIFWNSKGKCDVSIVDFSTVDYFYFSFRQSRSGSQSSSGKMPESEDAWLGQQSSAAFLSFVQVLLFVKKGSSLELIFVFVLISRVC